jgi:hypothetical protein
MIELQILLRAGTRHVTGCHGVVVVQDCDEEGVDAAGGAYCARFSQQIALQAGETTTPVRIGKQDV